MKITFSQISTLEDMFKVTILLAKIKGYRWAFENNSNKKIPISTSKRIRLDSNTGFVVYNWDCLEKNTQIQLSKKLLEMEIPKK